MFKIPEIKEYTNVDACTSLRDLITKLLDKTFVTKITEQLKENTSWTIAQAITDFQEWNRDNFLMAIEEITNSKELTSELHELLSAWYNESIKIPDSMVEDKDTSMIKHVNNKPSREKIANFHRRYFMEKNASWEKVFDERKLLTLVTYMMIDDVAEMNEAEREKYFTNHKNAEIRTFRPSPLIKDVNPKDL